MKTIYHVVSDEVEAEGMFDESGELLGAWCLNDAMWRREYMNLFMQKLGVSIIASNNSELVKKLNDHFDH